MRKRTWLVVVGHVAHVVVEVKVRLLAEAPELLGDFAGGVVGVSAQQRDLVGAGRRTVEDAVADDALRHAELEVRRDVGERRVHHHAREVALLVEARVVPADGGGDDAVAGRRPPLAARPHHQRQLAQHHVRQRRVLLALLPAQVLHRRFERFLPVLLNTKHYLLLHIATAKILLEKMLFLSPVCLFFNAIFLGLTFH